MTQTELTRLYARYNKKFFDNKLPAESPIVLVDFQGTSDEGWCVSHAEQGVAVHTICLDKNLKDRPNVLKNQLLHEMIHVKLHPYGEHDQIFYDEVGRLVLRGALKGIW